MENGLNRCKTGSRKPNEKKIAVIQALDGSSLARVVTVGMERRKQSLKEEAELTNLSSSSALGQESGESSMTAKFPSWALCEWWCGC